MAEKLLNIELRFERDVVQARQRAREIAAVLGFDHQEQIRIATATSEIARNAFRYATGGCVVFSASTDTPQRFEVLVTDKGKGIPRLEQVLEGRYRSDTGMGMGIIGTRKLMDEFRIESSNKGTEVYFAKHLPRSAPYLTSLSIRKMREEAAKRGPDNPYEEIQLQNLELMKTLSELRARQDELDRLNLELEDTNRGVVALYAELEDRADYLRRTAELKSTFLSNMSHEFRTPLNSIISLARMLGESDTNPLDGDQQREVRYIQNSARDLLELVNDLLDMAKIEAGKLQVRPRTFEVSELFGALRGMLKPLLSERSMTLVFEDPVDLPSLYTDEGKLSQILRNLISNAIKFTPKGEVRVSATIDEGEQVVFTVADTGIGISEGDLEKIFQEFSQIDNELQSKYRGTGLGLPLSQNLANLLGGTITVESKPGIGSTFRVTIQREYKTEDERHKYPKNEELDANRLTILVMEDNHETQYLYRSYLEKSPYQMIGVRNPDEAREFLRDHKPAAIVCDLMIDARMEVGFISELRRDPNLNDVPILAVSIFPEEQKALAAGATAFQLKPFPAEVLRDLLGTLTHHSQEGSILLIDDQEVARYVLRQFLPIDTYRILEARSGREGLAIAKSEHPDVIFLDLAMSDMDGYAVLTALKEDAATRSIRVIIHTSQPKSEVRRSQLSEAFDILPKSVLGEPDAEDRVDDLLRRAGIKKDAKVRHA